MFVKISLLEQLGGIMYAHDFFVIRKTLVAMVFENINEMAHGDAQRVSDILEPQVGIPKSMSMEGILFNSINMIIYQWL